MTDRLVLTRDRVLSSFWFVPTLMAIASVGLAALTLRLDKAEREAPVSALGWVYAGGADGARTVLSTVAGSMISVAGTAFSLTMVVLTIAASQFGPRLIRAFIADRRTQVVLGTFTATFLYCLLVLRTIRSAEEQEFVPHISVAVGLGLALVSVGVLIFFIHHVAVSTQVNHLIGVVGRDLDRAVERLFPGKIGRDAPRNQPAWGAGDVPPGFEREARQVAATGGGYVQAMDDGGLIRLASARGLLVRLERRPGDFVVRGEALASVWPPGRVDPELERRVRDAFLLGPRRTLAEDVEFAVLQLVEIAVRALSPSINDPFTATYCADRLGAALARLAEKEAPSAYRYDERELRVIAHPVTFEKLVDAALSPIRQYGRSSQIVAVRLLEVIRRVAAHAHRPEDLAALRRQADLVAKDAREALPDEDDRRPVADCHRATLAAIEAAASPQAPARR